MISFRQEHGSQTSGGISTLNLDTHILLHAVGNRLRPAERKLLDDDFWTISGIVLCEIAWLHRERRIDVSLDDPQLRQLLRTMTIWPISREVGLALRQLDFRADPADEIIAATSIHHRVPLLTRDSRLLTSKVVPLAAD